MLKKLLSVLALLAVLVLAVYTWRYLAGGARQKSPEELLQEALAAADAGAQERAAASLAAYGKAALPQIRQLLNESKAAPVRALCIQALGAACDYPSMPLLLAALDDDSLVVRARAGAAANSMLGRQYPYVAEAPAAERAPVVASMRELWQNMEGSPLLEEFQKRRQLK